MLVFAIVATLEYMNMNSCMHDNFPKVLCNAQAATALGLELIDVKEANQKDSQAVHSILSKKKTAATPVSTETVIVPVNTVPAVAVSGNDTRTV